MLKLLNKVFKKNKTIVKVRPRIEEELIEAGWVRMPGIEEIKRMEEVNEEIPKEIVNEVEQIIMNRFKDDIEKGRIEVRRYIWVTQKALFKERGYEWYSPKEIYPHMIFD